jgi:hypothetical protein
MQLADDIAGGAFAYRRNKRVHRGGKARAQKRQSEGQRHPLMLKIAFAHTLGMGKEQSADHGHTLIATHYASPIARTCMVSGLPE